MTRTDTLATLKVKNQLQPCPHCYTKPKVLVHANTVEIVCGRDKCRDVVGRTINDAISLWNAVKRP